MKTRLKNWSRLVVLVVAVGSMSIGRAQTFTTLHSFNEAEGSGPGAELMLLGNLLYGTSYSSVFAMNVDGSGFTILHNLGQFSNLQGGLTLSNGILYGTSSGGVNGNSGTVFVLNTNGTGFTNLVNIPAAGNNKVSGLILSEHSLFGLSLFGGYGLNGMIFRLNTDGSGFTNLHSFNGGSDGRDPTANLVLSSNILYGTTQWGGSSNAGTLFAIHTDGTGYTNLHSFTGGSEGAFPNSLMIQGNKLFGTTRSGGSFGSGTVYSINVDGTESTVLHSFTGNSDGYDPEGRLVLAGSTLYGTTAGTTAGSPDTFNGGTVFALTTDGTGFTVLHRFTGGAEGEFPYAGVIASGNTLYGVTVLGGAFAYGTAFSISLLPQLTIVPTGQNVILTWPTNYAGFDYSGFALQSTTNLASRVWTTNLPAPVVLNGQYTVTNPISGTQQFFRLSQ